MPVMSEDTKEHLASLVKKHKNILLTGSHGIGKTFIIMAILRELGYIINGQVAEEDEVIIGKIKYYSCATLDPWVDLVGIPIPNQKTDTLKFCRPKDLLDAAVIVADEINRSHPKVQNALLEIIQFRTINGQPLPKLKFVIAMQNPATKMYQVTDLDPALVDRFHARITLTGKPSVEFYKTRGITEDVGMSLVDWWTDDLNDENRELVTPRTLEAIGGLIRDGLNWKFSIGESLDVPLMQLEQRLSTNCGISKYEGVTLKHAVDEDIEVYAELAKTDRDFATHIMKHVERSRAETCWDAAEILVALPEEFQMRLMMNQRWVKKMNEEYKQLHKSFYDCDEVKVLHQKLVKVGGTGTTGSVDPDDYVEEEEDSDLDP